jgi:hypothetical protein
MGQATGKFLVMRRFLFLFFIAASSLSFAQGLESGYYRVSNLKTGRYVYVKDNKGSIDIASRSAEMGALELWKDHSRTISDPASVIYIEYIDSSSGGAFYDLKAQGTGVHDITDYYVYAEYSKGSYQVYAEGLYLCDSNYGTGESGQMGTNRSGDYRRWLVSKIDTVNEFFGIKPSVSYNGRYFHPFYADFGFSVGEGMKVWVVNSVNASAVELVPFEGNIVPAMTPVVIECSSENVDQNKLDIVRLDGTVSQSNLLKGVLFNNATRNNRVAFDGNRMRVLGIMPDGNLGYVYSTDTPDEKDGKRYLAANQSYLAVSAGLPDNIRVFFPGDENDVEDILIDNTTKAVYTIWGTKVGDYTPLQIKELPEGIYIIDNKKVIIR